MDSEQDLEIYLNQIKESELEFEKENKEVRKILENVKINEKAFDQQLKKINADRDPAKFKGSSEASSSEEDSIANLRGLKNLLRKSKDDVSGIMESGAGSQVNGGRKNHERDPGQADRKQPEVPRVRQSAVSGDGQPLREVQAEGARAHARRHRVEAEVETPGGARGVRFGVRAARVPQSRGKSQFEE